MINASHGPTNHKSSKAAAFAIQHGNRLYDMSRA
jgi:hypothetical protein